MKQQGSSGMERKVEWCTFEVAGQVLAVDPNEFLGQWLPCNFQHLTDGHPGQRVLLGHTKFEREYVPVIDLPNMLGLETNPANQSTRHRPVIVVQDPTTKQVVALSVDYSSSVCLSVPGTRGDCQEVVSDDVGDLAIRRKFVSRSIPVSSKDQSKTVYRLRVGELADFVADLCKVSKLDGS